MLWNKPDHDLVVGYSQKCNKTPADIVYNNMPNPANMTDEELVASTRKNSKELYSEIIRRYQTKLSHYLCKFIKTNDELEDVLQEIFIKAYRNLFSFDISRKFAPWIYRIARNEALNHIKRNSKLSISIDQIELDIIDNKIDLNRWIDQMILRQQIQTGMATMKDKYREPLILYFFEQRSYEEIGEILRITRSTVGILIMRGKKMLKEFLQKKYDRQYSKK